VGALLALVPADWAEWLSRLWKPGALYLVVCLFSVEASAYASMPKAYIWNALAAASVIAKIVTDQASPLTGMLSERALARLGTVSYGFYLWHYPVIRVLLYSGYVQFGAYFGTFGSPRLAMFIACFLASLLPAALSWWLVEKPLLQRRRRVPAAIHQFAG
jgi:peptidoglycan/LPS O-acetylase OafA/YrhL